MEVRKVESLVYANPPSNRSKQDPVPSGRTVISAEKRKLWWLGNNSRSACTYDPEICPAAAGRTLLRPLDQAGSGPGRQRVPEAVSYSHRSVGPRAEMQSQFPTSKKKHIDSYR